MKRIVIIVPLFLIGCQYKPDGVENGRAYDLVRKCVESHTETVTQNIYYGKNVWRKRTDDIEVCDKWDLVKVFR